MTFEKIPASHPALKANPGCAKKRWLRTWENLSEFLTYAAQEPAGNRRQSRAVTPREYWDYGAGFDGAMNLAINGWPEGLQRIRESIEAMEAITASLAVRPEVHYDVSGDYVDMGRFVTGEPECMAQFHEVELPQTAVKIIRIVANVCCSSGIDADGFVKRGAATLALIDALENSGRRCELIITMGNGPSDGTRLEYVIPVKKSGEMVEMDRLAFVFAHPAFFRRLVFAAMEHEAPSVRQAFGIYDGQGYGNVEPSHISDQGADVVVPGMLWTSTTEECVKWVMAELKKQGVEIREGAGV